MTARRIGSMRGKVTKGGGESQSEKMLQIRSSAKRA
jgi:hypothetical protein